MSKIMVIGSGVVGQANGTGLVAKGHEVVFVDKDPKVVEVLKDENLAAYLPDQIDRVSDVDIALFCTSTPFRQIMKKASSNSNNNQLFHNDCGYADLNDLKSAIINYAKWLKRKNNKKRDNKRFRKKIKVVGDRDHARSYYHSLVVIRSTVPPGTTRNVLLPLLEFYSGMKVRRDIGLCIQPEFLRSASSKSDFLNPRAIVIGEFDRASGDILQNLYTEDIFRGSKRDGDHGSSCQIFRTDLETAEFMKYIHNCFNATKISFANEMWLLGQKLGIDANLAIKMAVQTAEGFWNPVYGTIGGRAYDGRCLPKDIRSFLCFAKDKGCDMPLLCVVDSINSYMMKLNNMRKQTSNVIDAIDNITTTTRTTVAPATINRKQ